MSKPLSALLKLRGFTFPKSYTAPLLISAVLLSAHISFGILDGYLKLGVAIASAFAAEAFLHKIVTGRWRNMSSAYISGISTGILVRSPFYWPFAFCAMVSIASKYVLRYKGRHLWNPTNFGVVILILLASDSAAILSIQWGSNMWAMLVIWVIGLLTLWRVGLFHVSAVYVTFFTLFAWVRSLLTGDPFIAEVAPMTGPMYQLFVMFMITDPRTTVSTKQGRCLVAFLIAFVELLFRLNEFVYAPFYALFVVGPIALMAELWWQDRIKGE